MPKNHSRRAIISTLAMGVMGAVCPRIVHAANIPDVIAHYSQLSEWRRLAALVGVQETLARAAAWTVFVPTNLAFEYLADNAKAELNNPNNRDILKRVLNYHIVKNALYFEDLTGRVTQTPTLAGREISIIGTVPRPKIGDATFIKADIKADNGVIHVIDGVLWPRL